MSFALHKINQNSYRHIYIVVRVVVTINIRFYRTYLHDVDIIKTQLQFIQYTERAYIYIQQTKSDRKRKRKKVENEICLYIC